MRIACRAHWAPRGPLAAAWALAVQLTALRFATAELQLHTVFNDGMVLQRGAACVYGGGGGADATVELRWSAAAGAVAGTGGWARAAAAPDGTWRVCMPHQAPYGGPHELRVRALESAAAPEPPLDPLLAAPPAQGELLLRDVLLGDVWLGSGQSNMAMYTNKAWNFTAECASADALPRDAMRFMEVPGGTTLSLDGPKTELYGRAHWSAPSANVACSTSAVGFFFARALAAARPGAPVGVVIAAVDGSSVSPWMPAEVVAGRCNSTGCAALPGGYYNGHVAPLRNFTLRGVIWWQGETDITCAVFACRTHALIDTWRQQLSALDAPLPFLMVQLPPYVLPSPAVPACGVDGSGFHSPSALAETRLAQAALAAELPRVGLVSAIDCGDTGSPWWPGSIHTRFKRPVGERLAAAALRLAHGRADVATRGPRLLSVTQLRLSAKHPLAAALRLRFRLARDGAPIDAAAAFARSAPGAQFTVWFANRTRVAASVIADSLAPDGFDLGIPYWGDDRAANITRAESYMADFPVAQVWDAHGLPMEPWAVVLTPGADGLWGWGERLPCPPAPPAPPVAPSRPPPSPAPVMMLGQQGG